MDDQNEVRVTGEPTETPKAEEGARLSALSRLTGIFFSPGEVFADVNRKPTWLVPVLLSMVVAVGFSVYFHRRVPLDIEQITREQMQERASTQGTQLTDEQMDRALSFARLIEKAKLPLAAIVPPLVILVVSAIFFFVFQMLQAETNFARAFSVVAWAHLARSLVEQVLSAVVITVNPQIVDPKHLDAITMTNLGAFFSSKDLPRGLHSVLASIDLFTIWFLILLAIGFSAISKRIPTKKAAKIILVVWILWIAVKAGFRSIVPG